MKQAEQLAESAEVTEELRQQALSKEHAAKDLGGAALENQIRKNRFRWLREYLTEAGMRRAAELGWPNTYTLTKSLAESLIAKSAPACRSPWCVPRSWKLRSRAVCRLERGHQYFGLAFLSAGHLVPPASHQRAEVPGHYSGGYGLPRHDADRRGDHGRRHEPLYQLATSVTNPCDMRRSIELTSLAHRKHYRAQEGWKTGCG